LKEKKQLQMSWKRKQPKLERIRKEAVFEKVFESSSRVLRVRESEQKAEIRKGNREID